MSTRSYDFVTGIETSAAPTQADASADGDFVAKGYADKTYAMRSDFGADVANYAALTAISDTGTNSRADGQVRLVQDTQELWMFEASSSATEDGVTILAPDSGTGRWLIVSGGSGGASGSSINLEFGQLVNKLKSVGFRMPEIDNSALASSTDVPFDKYITGYLIQNYTASDTTAYIVWNPKVLNDSDKNYDATTNWTAVGAGATLTTSATSPKVGSNKLVFDKNGSATTAGIRYDRGSQNLSLGANYRVWFWINLPSVTGLTNVYLRVYADTTSNYRTWTETTNYAGTALAIGWNLMFVDISTGGSASGTGWLYSQLSRYVEVGVTTGSAGQTYTAINFDGIFFSHGPIDDWNPKGLEFTILDTSTKDDIVVDEATSFMDGAVTLNATIAEGYTAGISNSDAATVRRNTISWATNKALLFDSTLSSGAIALEQEARFSRVLRETFSGNIGAYVDYTTPLMFRVTAVGGSTIDVEDANDLSAQLLNGEDIYIFSNSRQLGTNNFALLAERSMTSNASHSSGTTTLTVTTTDIEVGDYVVKKELTSSFSLTAKTSPESMSLLTLANSPNGAILNSTGLDYPNKSNLLAHWRLGALTDALALEDIAPKNTPRFTLNKIGSPNLQAEGQQNFYAIDGMSTSNYLRTNSSTVLNFAAQNELYYLSFWFYKPADVTSSNTIYYAASFDGSAFNGHWAFINSSDQFQFSVGVNSPTPTNILSSALGEGWYHAFIYHNDIIDTQQVWINGVSIGTATANMNAPQSGQAFYVGVISLSGTAGAGIDNGATQLKVSDLIIWNAGSMGTSDALYLYNSGVQAHVGKDGLLMRENYSVTGQSGQRITMKVKANRNTNAVNPMIFDMGIMKV